MCNIQSIQSPPPSKTDFPSKQPWIYCAVFEKSKKFLFGLAALQLRGDDVLSYVNLGSLLTTSFCAVIQNQNKNNLLSNTLYDKVSSLNNCKVTFCSLQGHLKLYKGHPLAVECLTNLGVNRGYCLLESITQAFKMSFLPCKNTGHTTL